MKQSKLWIIVTNLRPILNKNFNYENSPEVVSTVLVQVNLLLCVFGQYRAAVSNRGS